MTRTRDRWVRVDFDGSRRVQALPVRLTKRALCAHLSGLRGLRDDQIRFDRPGHLILTVDVRRRDGWEPLYTITG